MGHEDPSASTLLASYLARWRPFLREADLARMTLATGMRGLSSVNHTQPGSYTHAFFNLSVGLERVLKLIVLVDHAVLHAGTFPTEETLRKQYGHDLQQLFAAAESIRARFADKAYHFESELIDRALAENIIAVLSEFSIATRYYNLDYLVGTRRLGRDPMTAWASDVAEYLALQYPARLQAQDTQWASFVDDALGARSLVIQETERGDPLESVAEAVSHGRRGIWIAREAKFHVASLVRYITELFRAFESDIPARQVLELPALTGFFAIYHNSDSYLRRRRTF